MIECDNEPPFASAMDCPSTAPCYHRQFCVSHRADGHRSHYAQQLRNVQTADSTNTFDNAGSANLSDTEKCSIVACGCKWKTSCLDCHGLRYCGRHRRHSQHKTDKIVRATSLEPSIEGLETVEEAEKATKEAEKVTEEAEEVTEVESVAEPEVEKEEEGRGRGIEGFMRSFPCLSSECKRIS